MVVKPDMKNIAQKRIKRAARDLLPACILLFVSCFMLFIFEPILMYATNASDIWFDFQMMIWPVLIIFFAFFLAGIIMICVIYCADLLLTGRLLLYKGILLAGFAAFFLLYLQGNWLIGNLPLLTGTEIAWENYGKLENIVLLSAMVILAAAVIISIKKRGLDRTVFYATVCTSVVFVMLFSALISTVVTKGALDGKRNTFVASMKNFDTISSNKNFLIFLADCADSSRFYNVIMGDDEFRGMMEDFTYYPDTLSMYGYTRDSISYILTGIPNLNKTEFRHYSSGAYNQSALFEKLARNGYEINLYTSMVVWEGERNYNIENAASLSDVSIDLYVFLKEEAKYVLFKYLPYGVKQFSSAEMFNLENCKAMSSEDGGYSWSDLNNYAHITENSVLDKQTGNYFQFIHCEGVHPPFNLDKGLNSIKGGTFEQKAAAAATVIKAYLQRLKDNDAYDNSVIVIMADHGLEDSHDPEMKYVLDRFDPSLYIKGINEKHEMLVSDRSVSYMDLQEAFGDLIEGKQSTELFAELEPGRVRTFLLGNPNLQAAQNYPFIEYSTTGTAREAEKFTPTGKVYDPYDPKG